MCLDNNIVNELYRIEPIKMQEIISETAAIQEQHFSHMIIMYNRTIFLF